MFDMSPASLFLSIVMSSIAIGYYSWGKKHSGYFQICGGLLLIITFFVSDFWELMGIGIALIVLPFILERISR
jgi:hypothetical protein